MFRARETFVCMFIFKLVIVCACVRDGVFEVEIRENLMVEKMYG